MAEKVDDPLQAALDEAQQLMNDLEGNVDVSTSSADIAGFSIDSDEDEPLNDSADDLVHMNGDPKKEAIAVHPLADDFLQVANPPEQAPSTLSTASSMSSTAPIINNTNQNAATPVVSSPSIPAPVNAAPYDALKAQTSKFASNFIGMAQKAANQVATATGASSSPSHISPLATTTTTTTFSKEPLQVSLHNAVVPVELDNEQKATLIQTHVGDLLPGERVIMFLSNLLHVSDSTGFQYSHTAQPSVMWCCAMTYYRLILFGTHPSIGPACPLGWNAACWPPTDDDQDALLQMPLASMDKVEKSVFTTATGTASNPTTLMGLLIHGKDNGRQLRFTTPSYADTLRAHEALQTYAFPGRRNLGYLFAFESKREKVMTSVVTDEATGQKTVTLEPDRKRFDAVPEFHRQFSRGGNEKNRPWAIWTKTNNAYQTCMSYPSVLVGPASLDENIAEGQRIIRQCAAFRSENRLPALTWTSGIDGASLWRCSQPKIGLQGNRSTADELFLKHILESASSATALADEQLPLTLSRSMLVQLTGGEIQNWVPESGCGLKILDLRPRSAAMANRTGGYGYENTSNYPGTTLQFCNIGNIHAVRDAYQKLSALCLSPSTSDVQWNALLEDTKWLQHVRLILAASWEAAFWIHVHRLPVLLHCSHGWDRTSQVAVLAQLLLDPYFRTREGFSTLIQKDFMSFGHPFHLRCGHGEGRGEAGTSSGRTDNTDEGQISPIFMQFLDCVYQLVNQYPECFEFNTKYLLLMSEHVYSCRFGNFLCDTEREREMVAGIRQRTHSLWEYLDGRKDTINPTFSPSASSGVLLMPLPTLLRNVSLWTDRHCMHGPKPTLRWLPLGVQRPDIEYERNQHGRLVTAQETHFLIANMGKQKDLHTSEQGNDAALDDSSAKSEP